LLNIYFPKIIFTYQKSDSWQSLSLFMSNSFYWRKHLANFIGPSAGVYKFLNVFLPHLGLYRFCCYCCCVRIYALEAFMAHEGPLPSKPLSSGPGHVYGHFRLAIKCALPVYSLVQNGSNVYAFIFLRTSSRRILP